MLCIKKNKNNPGIHTLHQNILAKGLFLKTTSSLHVMVAQSIHQGAGFVFFLNNFMEV